MVIALSFCIFSSSCWAGDPPVVPKELKTLIAQIEPNMSRAQVDRILGEKWLLGCAGFYNSVCIASYYNAEYPYLAISISFGWAEHKARARTMSPHDYVIELPKISSPPLALPLK